MKYEVNYPPYHGEEWYEYDCYNAEEAAKKFGVSYNEDGDYTLMNNEIFVRVRDSEGNITIVCVSAEPDIHYMSREVEQFKCHECYTDILAKLKEGHELYHDNFCSRDCYQKWRKEILNLDNK